MKHLLIVALDKGQLKSVFRRVNLENAGLGSSVKAVHIAALDLDQIDSLVEGSDNAVVTVQESVLDMVQSRVEQNTSIVPSSALDTNRLM